MRKFLRLKRVAFSARLALDRRLGLERMERGEGGGWSARVASVVVEGSSDVLDYLQVVAAAKVAGGGGRCGGERPTGEGRGARAK